MLIRVRHLQLPEAVGEVEAGEYLRVGVADFLEALVDRPDGVFVGDGLLVDGSVVQDYAEALALLLGYAEYRGVVAAVGLFNEARLEPAHDVVLDELEVVEGQAVLGLVRWVFLAGDLDGVLDHVREAEVEAVGAEDVLILHECLEVLAAHLVGDVGLFDRV